MKVTTILIFAFLMQVSAAGLAQKITLNVKNATLESVMEKIRSQTGYEFVFNVKDIDNAKKVNVSIQAKELNEALEEVFQGQTLSFSVKDKFIVVKLKEKSFIENIIDRFQNIDVSGRVVDTDGRGLPGASVSVKGKGGKAVSTGTNGGFYLKGVDDDATLVISFIGYVPKEVKATKELDDVILEISTSKLDEVQVIAYGTTTQRLGTGNVTTIKADVIEKQPVNNPLLALQGRVPGLFIEQATGFAGTGVKVRIQGQNSNGLYSGNDPLYVIDGIPFISQLLPVHGSIPSVQGRSGTDDVLGNPLNFINPADIESIDILKDAGATAIYGSRAANGVILITTKKGKSGDIRVNVNLQSGWAKVPRKLKLMNSQEYIEMRKEALQNDGIATPDPGPYVDSDLNGNWDTTRYTDWQNELIGKSASYQDLNASVSGGNERTIFLVGIGHHRETNVSPGNYSDNKVSLRFNINSTSANQKFKVQLSGSYMLDNNMLPTKDLTSEAMTLAPVAPSLYKSDGGINWAPDKFGGSTFAENPIGYLFDKFSNKTSSLMSNIILSYQIIPGMEIKSNFGYNKLTSNINYKALLQSVLPEYVQYANRQTTFSNSDVDLWSVEPQITYNRQISKGKLELLIGTTIYKKTNVGSGLMGIGFSNDLVMDDILSATRILTLSSINSTYKYNAAFGRINYNWQDKYLLDLTGRRDGSSRFGPKSQFHNFAAAGAAWIFSNEKLFKNHLALVSFGKFRVSYGTTGGDQISDYQFLSLYDPIQQGVPYQGIVIYQPNRLTNPYLEWEETRKLQFGLDIGLFHDRILLNANYYRNRSSNQLNSYALPLTAGFSGIIQNSPSRIENLGWEFTIATTNILKRDFKWTSSFNITEFKTLLTSSKDTRFPLTAIVGEPLQSKRVFHFLGVNPATGIYQFEDRNGNATQSPDNDSDRIAIINTAPKFYGGFQNSFSYRNVQLDFFFSFVKQIAPNPKFGIGAVPGSGQNKGNQLASLNGRWRKPGDISTIQRFTSGFGLSQSQYNLVNSDAAWTDASYIRLKNVSLSWKLSNRVIRNVFLKDCSLFVQGQNLLTVTKYKGMDPETKSSTTLPPLRVITFGLKVAL